MAKDDYYVIAYRILVYLYACLKEGSPPDFDYLKPDSNDFQVTPSYWEYIIRHLYLEGYLEGVKLIPITGRENPGIKVESNFMITPKGIDFLQNNSAMSKAKEFLKTLKESIPGL